MPNMAKLRQLTYAVMAEKDSNRLEFYGSTSEWVDHMVDVPDTLFDVYNGGSKQLKSVLSTSIAEVISISIMDRSRGGFHTAIRAIRRLIQVMASNDGGGGGYGDGKNPRTPKAFAGSKRKLLPPHQLPSPSPPLTKKSVRPTPKDRAAHIYALGLHKELPPAMQSIVAEWSKCVGKHLYNPRRQFGSAKSVFHRPLNTILGFWDTRGGTTLRVASQFIPTEPKTATYTFRIMENGTIKSQCGQTYTLEDVFTWEELNQ